MSTATDEERALCEPFLSVLPVAGLSIALVSGAGSHSTVATSDLIAARLDELQFQLGEGPTPDVLRDGRAVLAPDLDAATVRGRWPVFAPAASDTGARSLFAFPLLVGRLTIGVVSLYALVLRPPWPDGVVQAAVRLVDAAVDPAVALATRAAGEEAPRSGGRPTELRREVHQAAGMAMVQLGGTVDEAMSRIRAHAFATGRPIEVVAQDVIGGALDFRRPDA